MGIHLFTEVLDHAPDSLTWRERHALSVLAECANDATRECWPGIEDDPQLVRRMRVTGRSGRYAVLRALREKKVLQTVVAGHRGQRAVYRIAELAPVAGAEPPDARGAKACGDRASCGAERNREQPRKGPDPPGEEVSRLWGHFGEGRVRDRPPKRPEISDARDEEASGNPGPKGAERVREQRREGPDITDPFPSYVTSRPAGRTGLAYGIPEAARPLVEGLTAAGVTVRWPFRGDGWFPVLALISKTGIPAMVEHAVKAAARAPVDSARYFLPGWAELPPLPAGPHPAVPGTAAAPSPHCGALDCHPETRLREVQTDDGLPVLTPCPLCHPCAQGAQS